MASRRKKKRITLRYQDGVTVLDLGEMEIWDGADLALLRETLSHQIDREQCRSIGVDMHSVKYIPSGFFGMLYDWHDKGIAIHLFRPQHNVRNMLWFRRFFSLVSNDRHTLTSESAEPISANVPANWNNGSKNGARSESTNGSKQVSTDANKWSAKRSARSMSAAGRD